MEQHGGDCGAVSDAVEDQHPHHSSDRADRGG